MTCNPRKGVTLIEVSVGLFILSIIAVTVNSFLLLEQVSSLKQEKRTYIQNAVMQNVAELHGKKLSDYPAAGSCLARYYSPVGAFVREETGLLTATACTDTYSSNTGEIKVVLKFKNSVATTATFVPSQFLKLPKYTPTTLVEIEIVGSYNPPQSGSQAPPLTLVVLKRS